MAHSRQRVTDSPDPLTNQQLITVLRELAVLAGGDSAHDFGTVLDVYNDRARLASAPELSQAACQQVLRAVSAGIPKNATWRSDLMVVNRYLYSLRQGLDGSAAGEVLPELFRAAAVQVETRPTEQAESEVDDA